MGHQRFDLFECTVEEKNCVWEALTNCGKTCAIVCCDQPMSKIQPKTQDQGKEKHVPVIEKIEGGYRVKVGDVPHPMTEEHFIQWIELRTPTKVYREFLSPDSAPEAVFKLDDSTVTAFAYCNLHGYWTSA